MMKQVSLLAVVILSLVVVASSNAQTVEEKIAAADRESYLSLPEPPQGMTLNKDALVVGDEFAGFQLTLTREGEVSKVIITIELLDRSEDKSRLTACKGYVNGMAGGLKQAGWTLDPSTLPDINTLNVKKPIDLDLVFTNDKEEKLLVWKRMFFTTKGFDVNVIAVNQEDLEKLQAWAKKVRPVVAK